MNYVTVVIPGKIYSATQSLGNKVSKPAIGVHTEEPFWSVNANNCSCSLATLCIKLLSMTYKLMMSRVTQYEWLWTGVHVNTKKINLSVEFTHKTLMTCENSFKSLKKETYTGKRLKLTSKHRQQSSGRQ